jgi:leucyl-tRNA synthetase
MMTHSDAIEITVQVNGKVRSRISIPRSADHDAVKAAAFADGAVKTHTEGKETQKCIYVSERIINVIAK